MHAPLPYRTNPYLTRVALIACAVVLGACASSPSTKTAKTTSTKAQVVHDTVEVRDPDLERRAARAELRLMEKEAQVDELQTRLEDARDEVVRTMAKLQTLASRAEAASAMAEADVALQALRTSAAGQQLPEIPQAAALQQQSNSEFNKQNFGGALYLATQVKNIAAAGRTRAAAASRGPSRQGETQLALPVRVKVSSRGNVREGPGTSFGVVYPVSSGDILTAYSYTDDWVRVSDDGGRSGWIFRSLVGRP
ncbi:MAG TPA: SH3 domain-containing protein [Gemmatimonadaceae bacterium]|nr:SH3 domain-containing protein [Gemmatimonadaceae bacterium]